MTSLFSHAQYSTKIICVAALPFKQQNRERLPVTMVIEIRGGYQYVIAIFLHLPLATASSMKSCFIKPYNY